MISGATVAEFMYVSPEKSMVTLRPARSFASFVMIGFKKSPGLRESLSPVHAIVRSVAVRVTETFRPPFSKFELRLLIDSSSSLSS
jgi:hypothetical protein